MSHLATPPPQGPPWPPNLANTKLSPHNENCCHVAASFEFLYPKVHRDGVYLVEDLHTAYWQEYEGGLRRAGTFIEMCKGFIDDLNADHTRGALAPSEFTATTRSMHIYDSIIVFERGQHIRKFAPVIPAID